MINERGDSNFNFFGVLIIIIVGIIGGSLYGFVIGFISAFVVFLLINIYPNIFFGFWESICKWFTARNIF